MARKAYDKAREFLKSAFAATSDPDQRMAIGHMLYECLIRTQAYDEALKLGRELLTLNPTPQERLVLNQQLAALLHHMGKPAAAEALVTQAMSEERDAATQAKYEAQLRGIWRHTPGRTAEVVSNLTDRLATNPQDESALRQLGDIYLKSRRDHKAAQPVYEQLAALHPDDPQIQTALIGIYRENENYEGMRHVYEKRLAQSGTNDPTLRFQIAQTELQAGRGDEAVAYAEQHLAGDMATPFELQMLSTVYDKAGRKDDALATLDKAIALEGNAQQRVSMQFQKVDMLIWNKQYATAETLLRSIVAAAGDDQQTVSRAKGEIVRIYEMQGRTSELKL
jgi:tetratricopeptide (TPR) repeat protein